MNDILSNFIRYCVGSGERIRFWLDTWIGDSTSTLGLSFQDFSNVPKIKRPKLSILWTRPEKIMFSGDLF